ncbi:MAG: metal ABC transporter permease [Chloroflexi bacterium]|jgi:zinc transport system permease protein|nr:metal ABC transporter permease [Chloroflexota bacterium]MBT7080952.1 metal ABC transporter permease [Chloroflexota bacterium]MBT7290095.1 metal ABC transporter permease [Chloroflexota bacterium]
MFEVLRFEFMQNALAAGLLAAIACGIVGTYVVSKRVVFISGGIAHTSFGGVGLGYLIGINPVIGAMIFAVASALGIGVITQRTKLTEDTTIGILWAMGMAVGTIFIGLAPGYTPDLFSYLFGNILTVKSADLILMIILDAVIIIAVLALFKEFLSMSFDREFSAIAGVPVKVLHLLLLCLIALTIVVLIKVVGIILVIALLTIPATLARQFTYDLKKMMGLATLFGILFTYAGLWLSYILDVPSGATIILLSGAVLFAYLGTTKLRSRRKRKATATE